MIILCQVYSALGGHSFLCLCIWYGGCTVCDTQKWISLFYKRKANSLEGSGQRTEQHAKTISWRHYASFIHSVTALEDSIRQIISNGTYQTTDEQSWPLQVWRRTKRQHRIHSKHFIRASKNNLSPTKPRPTQQTSMKKGDGFKEGDLSNSPGPFLSTCCGYLLPWDFSTETLVCVSSRDTDFTYRSVSVYDPPPPNDMALDQWCSWHPLSFKHSFCYRTFSTILTCTEIC